MKRALSILLAALLLLVAVPTFAEERTIQAGLYVSDAGTELLYLDEKGVGVLNYSANDQFISNGVLWSETSLEIERTEVPVALADDLLFFTFDNRAMALRYKGETEAYALGERSGTLFAGEYAAEDGKKLTLTADGAGVYTDADGAVTVFWGSLAPYWGGSEAVDAGTCFILFDSYLSSMTFVDDMAVVNTEYDGSVAFRRQGVDLYYGYQMTNEGQLIDLVPFMTTMGMDPKSIFLILRSDRTGHIQLMDEESSADFEWTDEALVAGMEQIPYARKGDHIVLTVGQETIEFAPAAEVEALIAKQGSDTLLDPPEPQPLVGSWVFTRARAMGLDIPADKMGSTMSLVLNADGTAIFTSNDSTNEMNWALQDDGTVSLSVAGTEVFTMTFDGTVLILLPGTSEVEIVFEKVN